MKTTQQVSHRDLTDFILKKIRLDENPTTVRPNRMAKVDKIVEVKLSKDGGVYSTFENRPYPAKGFPYYDTVHRIDAVKKVFIGLAYGFANFRGKLILAFFLLFFRKRVMASARKLIQGLWVTVKPHRLKPLYYCNAVRELYLAFGYTTKPSDKARDLVCMILEFDDAYRYRFQYCFGELDKDNFRKNQYKELHRVLGKLIEREKEKKLVTYWRLSRKLLFIAYFFKDFRAMITEVISHINPANIRMDEGDEYYSKERHNF